MISKPLRENTREKFFTGFAPPSSNIVISIRLLSCKIKGYALISPNLTAVLPRVRCQRFFCEAAGFFTGHFSCPSEKRNQPRR